MKPSTADQIKTIYTVLGELKLREEKESIVLAFTGNRTSSVRAMSISEADALIQHLKSMDHKADGAVKMKRKILSMAHEMNWTVNGRIDMNHVNNWCLQYGYIKKKLDDFTYEELPQLITQFEHLYRNHIQTV